MASQWDNIEKVSPSEFDEVKSFLEKTFENDIHLHKFTEQNIESNDEIERNWYKKAPCVAESFSFFILMDKVDFFVLVFLICVNNVN